MQLEAKGVMAGARSLLLRVQKLEQARLPPRPPLSPIVSMCGSFEAYGAEHMAGIAAGKPDRGFGGGLAAKRRGEADGL